MQAIARALLAHVTGGAKSSDDLHQLLTKVTEQAKGVAARSQQDLDKQSKSMQMLQAIHPKGKSHGEG